MAEPPEVITFQQKPYIPFFMCRNCRNHVLLFEDLLYKLMLNGIVCKSPVNVRVDDLQWRWLIDSQPVVSVFCNQCNRNLGQQFVITSEPNEVQYVEQGSFILYTNRILFWNGKQVVYADTKQPVDEDNLAAQILMDICKKNGSS